MQCSKFAPTYASDGPPLFLPRVSHLGAYAFGAAGHLQPCCANQFNNIVRELCSWWKKYQEKLPGRGDQPIHR